MKKNNLIMIVVTISMFVVLLLGATYAYFASNTNVGNGLDMTITTDNNNIAFAATEGTLSMHVKAEDMLQSQTGSGDVLAAETVGEDNIVITLSTNTEAPIACTYNVYFQWNLNQVYTKTTGAIKELTLELNLNDEDSNGSEGTNSFAEETQITDVVTGTTKTKVVNGAYIVGSSSNSGTQEWVPTVRFYNLNKDQSALAGVTLGGKFTIEDVECNATENLSESVIAKAESAVSASGVKEYTSSQDATPYIIKRETITGAASDATYTKVTNYGTTSMYSATYSTAVSGTDASGVFIKSDDNVWSNMPGNMTSGKAYHLLMPIQENGYYEICYTFGTGNLMNILQAYITDSANTTSGNRIWGIRSGRAKSGCAYLGYLTTEEAIRIVDDTRVDIPNVSFYLQKTQDEEIYDAGVRYEGNDPDNYVVFNGEEWRIIGFFEGSTIGLEPGKRYTKIIRNESLGWVYWDCDDKNNNGTCDDENESENDWTNSTLNNYLNNTYLNGNNSMIEDEFGNQTKSLSLDAKNKIAKYNGNYSTWFLNGPSNFGFFNGDSSQWYLNERHEGFSGFRNGIMYAADSQSSNAIGIMYPSDYGYAAYGEKCKDAIPLKEYIKWNEDIQDYDPVCDSVDWIVSSYYEEWAITPHPDEMLYAAFFNFNNGYESPINGNGHFTMYGHARPTLYLEHDIQIAGGNGSKANPYKLS